MSPPIPRINTFMNVTGKPNIDTISKFFIIVESLLGVNRLHILGLTKNKYTIFMFGVTMSIFAIEVFCYISNLHQVYFNPYYLIFDFITFFMCSTLAFIFKKKLINFYNELHKFDEDIGFEANKTENRKNIQNISQMVIAIVLCLALYLASDLVNSIELLMILSVKIQQCIELHYYGHLLILITPRIKLLTNYIRFSYPNKENIELEGIGKTAKKFQIFNSQIKNFSKIEIKKLINLYNRIIIAFDFLYESMKWQVCIIYFMKNL